MPNKKSIVVGVAVAAVTFGGLGSVGIVSAATESTTSGNTSIVDKIASKFNVSTSDVQAVFDEDRAAKNAERKANQAERLATAVKDGKLTQTQADYITKAQAEMATLKNSSTSDTDTVRSQIKTKMEALRAWATDNNVDKQYLGGGHGGHGGPRGGKPSSTTSDSN